MSLPPHLDDVAGLLASVVHNIGRRSRYSLDRVEVYSGLDPQQVFPLPAETPAPRRRHRWKLAGVTSEDLIFPSPYRPLEPDFEVRYDRQYRRTHTVFVRRIVPPGAAGRPRLLYVHGYMQPETLAEELLIVAAMAQALKMEVWQVQPPYHGRRMPRRSVFHGELYWTADVVRSLEALRQTIVDARATLSLMLAHDDRPVGISGLSLGGTISAAVTCLDDRLAFSLPMIAHMDLAALLRDAPVLGRMRRDLRRWGWGPEEFGAFTGSFGWNTLQPALPPERIHLWAATDDRFFAPADVSAMWQAWGRPPIHWVPTSHMAFVTRLPWLLPRMRRFVDDLPPR